MNSEPADLFIRSLQAHLFSACFNFTGLLRHIEPKKVYTPFDVFTLFIASTDQSWSTKSALFEKQN